jgi:ParB family chromosome partitioning protein
MTNGLMEPLVVRPISEDTFALVAGAHRYRGLELAEIDRAECKILELSDAEARLAEIDENLMRRELTALDRAVFLAERKAVYEELHPETAHGKAPNGGKVANIATLRFTEDAAEKMGLSERTIQDAVALVANLTPEAIEALRDTQFASNAAQLKALSKLAPEQQNTCAKRIADGDFTSVKEWRVAVGDLPQKPEPSNPRDAWMVQMLKVWGEGKKKWREDFLSEIGGA